MTKQQVIDEMCTRSAQADVDRLAIAKLIRSVQGPNANWTDAECRLSIIAEIWNQAVELVQQMEVASRG